MNKLDIAFEDYKSFIIFPYDEEKARKISELGREELKKLINTFASDNITVNTDEI